MKFVYSEVRGLGKVVLSRHALKKADEQCVLEQQVEQALAHGVDRREGDVLWREHRGLRLIIIRPTPWKGAWLVKTLYWIQRQAKVR